MYGSDICFFIFSFCSASLRATICVIFILAMIRMTLAKKKAKKMGYKHIVSLPSCWSLSQLPNLISIFGSLVILIIIFVLSIHKKRISTEGDADLMNLWTYGADYIIQTLTTFILLFVIRKTVLNLLIRERQDTISTDTIASYNNFSETRFGGSAETRSLLLGSQAFEKQQ